MRLGHIAIVCVIVLAASPENRDLTLNEEPFKTALDMAEFLDGVPRYPKMHPCGVVLSRQPMHELTPTFISNKGQLEAKKIKLLDRMEKDYGETLRDHLAAISKGLATAHERLAHYELQLGKQN